MTGNGEVDAIDRLRQEIPPALNSFLATAGDAVLRTAASDGWPEAEAIWIERHMREPLLQRIANGMEAVAAFRESYRLACRGATRHIFEGVLAKGGDRDAAFRMVLEFTQTMAIRRGEAPAGYASALVQAGCEAVEAAAREGASTEDQVETGFAIMRSLAAGSDIQPQ